MPFLRLILTAFWNERIHARASRPKPHHHATRLFLNSREKTSNRHLWTTDRPGRNRGQTVTFRFTLSNNLSGPTPFPQEEKAVQDFEAIKCLFPVHLSSDNPFQSPPWWSRTGSNRRPSCLQSGCSPD